MKQKNATLPIYGDLDHDCGLDLPDGACDHPSHLEGDDREELARFFVDHLGIMNTLRLVEEIQRVLRSRGVKDHA